MRAFYHDHKSHKMSGMILTSKCAKQLPFGVAFNNSGHVRSVMITIRVEIPLRPFSFFGMNI